MKRFINFIPAVALTVLAVSCKPDLEEIPASLNGADLDLSNYAAFGDYNTAGFFNGGVNRESQQYAYPNILAKQFAEAGYSQDFVQPYFNTGSQMLEVTEIKNGMPVITKAEEMTRFVYAPCTPTPAATILEKYSTSNAQTLALRNFGIPGLRIGTNSSNVQLGRNGLGNAANNGTPANFNAYFERILPANDNRSYKAIANQAKFNFFTLWIGNSDVVTFGSSGATCGALPSASIFRTEVGSLLDSVSKVVRTSPTTLQATRKGVICNIPNVQDYAFTRVTDVAKLTQKLQTERNDTSVHIWIRKQVTPGVPNYAIVKATSSDYILAKGISTLGREDNITVGGNQVKLQHGLHKDNPLDNNEVLDGTEATFVNERIAAYNTELENMLNAKTSPYRGLVILADMKGLFSTLSKGVNYNGVKYSLASITGGVYSFDNFSLTPRGQAFVANKIIQTMNQEVLPGSPQFTGFGTKISEVNVNDFPALKLP